MACTIDLLAEIRLRIYHYVFAGEELVYMPYARNMKLDINETITYAPCTSLLLTSRQTYQESYPIFLENIRINGTHIIDHYYAAFKIPTVTLTMVRHLYLNAHSLGFQLDDRTVEEPVSYPSLERFIGRMPNLKSLSYWCDAGEYGFKNATGWIDKEDVRYIRTRPHRMLGWYDEGDYPVFHFGVVRSIIRAWVRMKKSFKLFAEADVCVEKVMDSDEEVMNSEEEDSDSVSIVTQ
jgi:hypothetical protein